MAFTGKPKNPNTGSFQYLHASILVGEEAVRIETVVDDPADVETYKIDIEDLPTLPRMPKKGTKITDCVVFLDKAKNKVLSINPWDGRFEMIAFDLGPKSDDGTIPVFKAEEKTGDNGKYIDISFWCAYEIMADPDNGGLFVGSKPRYHLKYKFVEAQDGGVTTPNADNPNATRIRQLLEWTNIHGIDQDMEWPANGNVLPVLLQRLQAKSVPVLGYMDKGYINKISKLRGAAVVVVEDEEEKVAPAAGLADEDFGKK